MWIIEIQGTSEVRYCNVPYFDRRLSLSKLGLLQILGIAGSLTNRFALPLANRNHDV